MKSKYVGVDIGGTFIKCGVFLSSGELLEEWSVDTDYSDEGRQLWPTIVNEIRKHVQEEELGGIGIGIPGPVLEDDSVEVCVNLNLHDFNPRRILKPFFPDVHIAVANDANVAALGEQWQGSGKGYQDIALVTLGTGVGCGIIHDGKIIYGANGLSGEVGHIQLDPSEPEPCSCGGYGCLNQIASAPGIVSHAKRFLAESEEESLLREIENISSRDVVEAVKKGDAIAEKTIRYCMKMLAKGLSAISFIVDPQLLIIGGGVSAAGDYILPILQEYYNSFITLSSKKTKIVQASLGTLAGIYGAAKLAMM